MENKQNKYFNRKNVCFFTVLFIFLSFLVLFIFTNATVQYKIGNYYKTKYDSVKSDLNAFKWYRKAAEQGHEEAKRLCADRINFKTKRKEYKCFVKNVAVN